MVSIAGRVPTPWASTYSAVKAGLGGFTEALRAELSAHSTIDVCAVYPPFVDTPTYLRSGNYTGRALRPVPPVVSPERVAEKMVRLALRPRRAVHVGTLHALALPHAVAPGLSGRVVARLAALYLLRSGAPAPASDGALFGPVPAESAVRARGGSASAAAPGGPRCLPGSPRLPLGPQHFYPGRAA